MLLCWAFDVISAGLAGLAGCYLFWALGVVSVDVAFSGFADETPWFLLAAILFGALMIRSGLARRIALAVMGRAGTSYRRLLLGLMLADAVLTFLVPSGVPRVIVMASIALGFNEGIGLKRNSNVARAMLLTLTYTATIFDKTIIAGVATITARQAIERFGHLQVFYSQWALAYLPIDLILIFLVWRLALNMFPPETQLFAGSAAYLREQTAELGAWSKIEKKAFVFAAITVLLWLLDAWHHVPASKIALGMVILAMLPGIGLLGIEDLRRVDFPLLIFVGSVTGMGKVLNASKALEVLNGLLSATLTPLLAHPFWAPFALFWGGFAYHLFLASGISMLGTSLPSLMSFAAAHHLNALAVGMIWTFSSSATIFAYQNAVLIVGFSYGCFTGKDLLRLGLILSLVDSLLLLIVVPLYWPLLGIRL